MLLLQWQREAINYGAENLEQLSHSVVPLRLVDEVVEDVVDLFPDEGSETEELAVDSMQRRLEEISLPRILRVKEAKQVRNESLVDKLLCQTGLKVTGFQAPAIEMLLPPILVDKVIPNLRKNS